MCTVVKPNLLADCQLSVAWPRKIGTNHPLQWVVVDFIDDNHTRNYNRILRTLSSNLNLLKADIQNFLNDIRAEYTVDCQMANFLKHNLQKSYEIYQKSGLNIDAINELLTTDSQAQEQLDQLLKTLTTILNAK